MSDDPVLFETEGGFIVLQGDEVLIAQRGAGSDRSRGIHEIGASAKAAGIGRIRAMDPETADELRGLGIESAVLSEEESGAYASKRSRMMVKAGFAPDEAAALEMMREGALAAAAEKISAESSREDLHLVHAIQALDELDRFLNITTERVAEWYSLHFPELQQLIQDNVALSRLIVETGGTRAKFVEGRRDEKVLEGKGFSDKKIEAILMAAERSKGGSTSERDMNRIIGLSNVALQVASEREKLAEYVESTMKRIAPNITSVAGATIGARLIAKAGGLDRLARLPASTVQVLGAEKALFRALRTGARPPKHGILFQHESVHTAPKWQRGKIARALANKIAIAARIDYYRGEKEESLTGTLEKRLNEIRVKYKEPREAPATKRGFRDERRPRFAGKDRRQGRKEFHKGSRGPKPPKRRV